MQSLRCQSRRFRHDCIVGNVTRCEYSRLYRTRIRKIADTRPWSELSGGAEQAVHVYARSRAQLLRDAVPMALHRSVGNAQLAGDLLRRQIMDEALQHPPFSIGDVLQAAQFLGAEVQTTRACGPTLRQDALGFFQRCQDRRAAQRLGHPLHRSQFGTAVPEFHITFAADHDHRGIHAGCAELPEQVEAVHARHAIIEQYRVIVAGVGIVLKARRRFEGVHMMMVSLEQALKSGAGIDTVVDDCNSKRIHGLLMRWLKRVSLPWWLMAAGTVLSVSAGFAAAQLIEQAQARELRLQAERAMHQVERRVGEYRAMLEGLRSLFDTFGNIPGDRFQHYIDNLGLNARYPGLSHVEYVANQAAPAASGSVFGLESLYVPPPEVAHFDTWQGGIRLHSNALSLSARDSAAVSGFGRVGVVTDGHGAERVGLGYQLPVYRPGVAPAGAPPRPEDYLGWVGAWVDIERMFGDAVDAGGTDGTLLRVSIDQPGRDGEAILHRTIFETRALGPGEGQLLLRRDIPFADHRFEVAVLAAGSAWQHWRHALIGAAVAGFGVALSALLAGVIRRRYELRLRDNERQIEQCSHVLLMGELAAAIAHELRSPLQGVVSGIDTIQLRARNGSLSQDRLFELLQQMDGAATRAIGRLEDIRQQMHADRADPVAERVDLGAVLSEIDAVSRRDGRRLTAALHVQPLDMPLCVAGNRIALEGVLSNLIRNASEAIDVAGRPDGRIVVAARPADQGKRVELVVEDNGPGFDDAALERLFQSFYTTKPFGTGLGLSSCRRALRRMGGEIRATNRPGGGAQFIIHLPLAGPAG